MADGNVTVITQLGKKGKNESNLIPIGTRAEYVLTTDVLGNSSSLATVLSNIELRLKNIEACLKEVAQEPDLDFECQPSTPVEGEVLEEM